MIPPKSREGDSTQAPNPAASAHAPAWVGLERMEDRILLSANPNRPPQLRINNSFAAEGTTAEPGKIIFQVRRSGTASQINNNRSVARFRTIVLTNNAQRAEHTTDFVWTQSRVVFQKGQRNQYITINLVGNDDPGDTKLFAVQLFKSRNANIRKAFGVGYILDNNSALPAVGVNDIFTLEGNGGTRVVNFTVSLSKPHNQIVTVDYATQDGSAVSTPHPVQSGPEDYFPTSGTLTFGVGEITKLVPVTIVADRFEAGQLYEVFYLILSNPSNATLGKATGTATIEDDDGKWAR